MTDSLLPDHFSNQKFFSSNALREILIFFVPALISLGLNRVCGKRHASSPHTVTFTHAESDFRSALLQFQISSNWKGNNDFEKQL